MLRSERRRRRRERRSFARRRVMADVSPAHLHVVFSAECIPAFDWQSAGLFYSFNRTRQPGKITRLLACSDEQLASYPGYVRGECGTGEGE